MVINSSAALFIMRIITILAIPFCFAISPYLALPLILLTCVLYHVALKRKHEPSFIIIFLFLTLFSGITLGDIRLYDWAILFAFIEILLTRKDLKLRFDIPCFMFLVLLIFFLNYHDYSWIAIARYSFSLTLLFIVYNKHKLFPEDKSIFFEIVLSAIYFALVIYIFITMGMVSNLENGILQTNIFLYNGAISLGGSEVRLNGFFSDPNKYMTYMFILLYLIEMFWNNSEKKYYVLICAIGAVLSLSRTALLVLLVFFFGRYLITKPRYSSLMTACMIGISICAVAIFVIFSNEIIGLGNSFFQFTGDILGREQTVMLNANLNEDNRILIWQAAWQLIEQSPLAGYGWHSERVLLPYPTHNTALLLLLDGGIVMLIGYVLLFRKLFFNKYWPIVLPLIIVPLLVLDLSDYRMEYLVLGIIWSLNRRRQLKDSSISHDSSGLMIKEEAVKSYNS